MKKIPYQVSDLKVAHYQGIINLKINDIPKNTPWIFLVGENGFGKTAVLRAIAKGLVGDEDLLEPIEPTCKIMIKGTAQGQPFKSQAVPKRKSLLGIPFAAYGAARFQRSDGYAVATERSQQKTYSLFKDDGQLINIELELIKNYAYNLPLFNHLVTVLKKMIPRIADIRVEIIKGNPRVRYREMDALNQLYYDISLDELAAGYRNVLTMIGDMMIRLYDYDSNTTTGIVLIDELDAHLHPKYQYELPRLLMEAFPQVQFIASVHSPIPLLGVGRAESFVLNVSRSVETGIIVTHNDIEVHRLNPNALLTSPIFGLQNLGAVDTDAAETAPVENYSELERTNLIKKRLQRLRQQGVIP
ncbi:MAG: hypothetical protein RIS64_439 [Bacteroidota bacterium]|jgi:predicted ATP-binding protein involved in virulence